MQYKEKSFTEILSMITTACCKTFYNGAEGIKEKVLECATNIYIAQMKEGDNNAE